MVTTEGGEVNDAHEYFPDGAAWIDSGKSSSIDGFLFSGKPFDPETGLYDFGQRFYDPRLSLWLGNDTAFLTNTLEVVGHPILMVQTEFTGWSPTRKREVDGRGFIDVAKFFSPAAALYAGVKEALSSDNPEDAALAMINATPLQPVARARALPQLAADLQGQRGEGRRALAFAQLFFTAQGFQEASVGEAVPQRAGAGGSWAVSGERVAEGGKQLAPNSCGPACGERLGGPSQESLIETLGTEEEPVGTDAPKLRQALGDQYRGGVLTAPKGPAAALEELLTKVTDTGRKWTGTLRAPGSKYGHFVVVEGRAGDQLLIFDPWNPSYYTMTTQEFLRVWQVDAVWKAGQ